MVETPAGHTAPTGAAKDDYGYIAIPGRKAIVLLLWVVAGLSLFFMFTTWQVVRFWSETELAWSDWPLIYRVMLLGNLAQENVPSVWFSSMLLLTVGLTFLLCFAAEPRNESRSVFRFGWAFCAAVFVGLSFDEMGSLHEKLALSWPEGGWTLMLWAFVLVIPLYMIGFGLVQLKRSPTGAALIIVGAACFTTIPIFEHFEIASLSATGTLRANNAMWQALEEGTELFGMIAFLAAALRFLIVLAADAPNPGLVRLARREGPILAVSGGIVLAAIAGIVAARRWDPVHERGGVDGIAEHWFVSAPLCAGALLTIVAAQSSGRLMQWTLAVAALVLSMVIGSNIQAYFWLESLLWVKWCLVGIMGLAAVSAAATTAPNTLRLRAIMASICLAAAVVAMPGDWVIPAAVIAIATVWIAASGMLDEKSQQG